MSDYEGFRDAIHVPFIVLKCNGTGLKPGQKCSLRCADDSSDRPTYVVWDHGEQADELKLWQQKALDAGNHPAVKALLEERDEARRQRDEYRAMLSLMGVSVESLDEVARTDNAQT